MANRPSSVTFPTTLPSTTKVPPCTTSVSTAPRDPLKGICWLASAGLTKTAIDDMAASRLIVFIRQILSSIWLLLIELNQRSATPRMRYCPTKRAGGNAGAQVQHALDRERPCRVGEPVGPARDSD